MKQLAPMAGRFTSGHEGYHHPAKLDAWEKAVMGPELEAVRWPGGSISGSDDGWDDCDE